MFADILVQSNTPNMFFIHMDESTYCGTTCNFRYLDSLGKGNSAGIKVSIGVIIVQVMLHARR